MPSLAQWNRTWAGLGVSDSDAVSHLFDDLMARYAEPHRRYHTARHLDECFARLDELRALAQHPYEIELALWFHDAIYEERGSQNEELSADWARSCALNAGASAASADRVHSLIMFTCHAASPLGIDAELLVDVDLSILGTEPGRFDEYESQVREEYAWVPDDVFRRERKRILVEFLHRPTIFSSALFQERYERQARSNLQRSIDRLSQGEGR